MEAIIYLLLITVVVFLAAIVNYRRSILKGQESVRLQKQAEQTLIKVHQEYKAAVQARLDAQQAHREAEQARDEANKTLEEVQKYWNADRLN